MSLTSEEVFQSVTDKWLGLNLGTYDATISVYAVQIQQPLTRLAVGEMSQPEAMLDILSQCWALLRWHGGFPVPRAAGWFPPLDGSAGSQYGPLPLIEELTTFPLEVIGANWQTIRALEYAMMANTYSRQLADGWIDDPATLWSAASSDATRHLFQVCYQYLLRWEELAA